VNKRGQESRKADYHTQKKTLPEKKKKVEIKRSTYAAIEEDPADPPAPEEEAPSEPYPLRLLFTKHIISVLTTYAMLSLQNICLTALL
jgi:hypothetical protein